MSGLATMKRLFTDERSQYIALAWLSAGAIVLAGIGALLDPALFQRFFGSVNPVVAVSLLAVLGAGLLSALVSRGWFSIFKAENLRGALRRAGLVALFGAAAILVDVTVVFPPDLNVVFPESLLFYPAIAFVAEILFHIVPLTLIAFALSSLRANMNGAAMWAGIVVVAMVEPAFQVTAGYLHPVPGWVLVWTGLHVFLINLSQLIIFKRNDFISMYLFRLVYYLIWHIVWGYARLIILF